MLGADHAYTAGAAGAVIAICTLPPGPDLFFTGATFAAGLACDIDEPGSVIARSYGALTQGLAFVVHKVSGGHRKGMHELPGEALTAGLAALCAVLIHDRLAQWVLGAILAILAASALEVLRIHRHLAEVAGIAAAAAVVASRYELRLIAWAILTGMAVHVVGDSLTKAGTTPFRPLWRKELHLLPRRLCITTGSWVERRLYRPVFAVLFLAALGFQFWRDAATAAVNLHAHLADAFPALTSAARGDLVRGLGPGRRLVSICATANPPHLFASMPVGATVLSRQPVPDHPRGLWWPSGAGVVARAAPEHGVAPRGSPGREEADRARRERAAGGAGCAEPGGEDPPRGTGRMTG